VIHNHAGTAPVVAVAPSAPAQTPVAQSVSAFAFSMGQPFGEYYKTTQPQPQPRAWPSEEPVGPYAPQAQAQWGTAPAPQAQAQWGGACPCTGPHVCPTTTAVRSGLDGPAP
jgi:hypothetical protein